MTHPAVPMPLEVFSPSRTGTQGASGHWGCSGISSVLGAGCWQLESPFPRHSALRGFPTAAAAVEIYPCALQAGLTAAPGHGMEFGRGFGGVLEEQGLLTALPLPHELRPRTEPGGSTNIPTLQQVRSLELLSGGEQGMKTLRHC